MKRLCKLKVLLPVALLIMLLLAPQALSKYSVGVLNVGLIFGIAAWSISIMLGMGGQLVFSTISFMGIGAYTVANLCTGRLSIALPTWSMLFIAPFVAGLAAFILSLILVKMKGTYFTFASIAVVQVAYTFYNNYKPLFGGPDGISGIPSLTIFGHKLANYYEWFYFLVVFLISIGLLIERIRRTQLGRSLASIRDNETAARTLGVNVFRTRVIAYTLTGVLGGLSGALYAMHVRYISADMFNYGNSAQIIIMTMIGGVNSTIGTIVGALSVNILPEIFRSLQKYMQLIWGLSVIILMIFFPTGLGGLYKKIFAKSRAKKNIVEGENYNEPNSQT